VRDRLAENLATLRDAVAFCPPLTAPTPAAGWYATLRLPAIRDDDAWTTAFAAVGVGVSPGWLFDFRGPPRVVVSLVTPPDIFAEGLRRLCGVVNDAARGL
jgi:DNA-binding transcriptional MocR family regulator